MDEKPPVDTINKPYCQEFIRLGKLLLRRQAKIQKITDPYTRGYAEEEKLLPLFNDMHRIDGYCADELGIPENDPVVESNSTFVAVCLALGMPEL